MLKSLIHKKNKTYKILRKSIWNNQQIEKLKSLQNRLKYGSWLKTQLLRKVSE